jgi:hypothetical protein
MYEQQDLKKAMQMARVPWTRRDWVLDEVKKEWVAGYHKFTRFEDRVGPGSVVDLVTYVNVYRNGEKHGLLSSLENGTTVIHKERTEFSRPPLDPEMMIPLPPPPPLPERLRPKPPPIEEKPTPPQPNGQPPPQGDQPLPLPPAPEKRAGEDNGGQPPAKRERFSADPSVLYKADLSDMGAGGWVQ